MTSAEYAILLVRNVRKYTVFRKKEQETWSKAIA